MAELYRLAVCKHDPVHFLVVTNIGHGFHLLTFNGDF